MLPVHHGPLLVRTRPEHHRDRDALRVAADRVDDGGVAERGREPLALQVELGAVDADRHVDRKHQLDVDGLLRYGMRHARKGAQAPERHGAAGCGPHP